MPGSSWQVGPANLGLGYPDMTPGGWAKVGARSRVYIRSGRTQPGARSRVHAGGCTQPGARSRAHVTERT